RQSRAPRGCRPPRRRGSPDLLGARGRALLEHGELVVDVVLWEQFPDDVLTHVAPFRRRDGADHEDAVADDANRDVQRRDALVVRERVTNAGDEVLRRLARILTSHGTSATRDLPRRLRRGAG